MRYGLVLVLVVGALAGNAPNQWIFFESRETGNGPQLEIEYTNGQSRILPADADTGVISYLADKALGSLPSLAVQLSDANRVLLRFDDLPAGGTVKRAELVLSMKLSEIPPQEPFEIAVHRLAAKWEERSTTWANQPPAHPRPDLKVQVEPKQQRLRLDVTKALRRGAPHGFLIKVPGALVRLDDVILDALKWAPDPNRALQQARTEKKLVLALVTAGHSEKKANFFEATIIAVALAHPEVKQLIDKRFVCVRLGYTPNEYTLQTRKPGVLAPLGTQIFRTKAPALVVSGARGKQIATLEAIGTYDHGIVFQFLATAARTRLKRKPMLGVELMRRGEFKLAEQALERVDADEAIYYRAALLFRRGEREAAQALWQTIVKSSPWWWKSRARLQWPYRMATCECLKAPAWNVKMRSTEREAKPPQLAGAVAYLLEHQRPGGDWMTADRQDQYQAAVTALCARALLPHAGARGAVDKATAWLRTYMQRKDPGDANAWSAGYTLDLFLDRMEKDKSFTADAQKAVELVSGGQGPYGAWSYSRNWGQGWKGGFSGWPRTDKGRYHSMNTGPCLASLARANKLGLRVDGEVLKKGVEALLKMRDEPGVFTYTYPLPRSFNSADASIARAPACEQALFMLGATRKADLKKALGYFLKYKKELRRPAKLTAAWTAPRGYSGYFYHFAYFHAAEAFRLLGDRRALSMLRKDLLAVAEADGTWTDWDLAGKPYATAMAMLVLR